MSEYTSLDTSMRLAKAGFVETSDDRYAIVGTDAYRADTLLAWLLAKDIDCWVWHNTKRTIAAQGRSSPDLCKQGKAATLPDALAELVIKVLEVKA